MACSPLPHPAAPVVSPASRPAPRLQFLEPQWEPVAFAEEEPTVPSQLLAKVYVNHCPMHFEAYLVDADGETYSPQHHRVVNGVQQALHDDETWQAITFGGRPYVVVAIPYGR